jgi:hypothetical protein
MSPNAGVEGGGALRNLSQLVQQCTAHGALINFGDLTPYLTYSRWELSGPSISIITLRLGYASDVAKPCLAAALRRCNSPYKQNAKLIQWDLYPSIITQRILYFSLSPVLIKNSVRCSLLSILFPELQSRWNETLVSCNLILSFLFILTTCTQYPRYQRYTVCRQ